MIRAQGRSAAAMHDVFVSYSRDDRETAQRFALGFEREGFSVWWDQAIVAGEAFDRATEKALREARAVVVLWSKRSVESDWVRAEATEARAAGRLVPAMIEPCKRPVIFELTQTADLVGWDGDAGDPRWRALVDGLRRTLAPSQPGAASAPSASPRQAPPARPRMRVALPAAVALAAFAAAGFSWIALRRERGQPPATDDRAAGAVAREPAEAVTLAVLPCANRSPDPAQEYFSDGLTEEILNQLANIPALRLTGRTSSFSFKGKDEDLRQIGARLGVGYLLEGSVRKDGDQLRVTARLVRAADGTHRWSQSHDRSLSGVFAVQDEIARDVARALSVTLDIGTLNRARGGTTHVEAFDAYLRWREFRLSERVDPDEQRRMAQRLREAVALDPGFLLAWDGLAQSLTLLARRAPPSEAAQLQDEAAAARARLCAVRRRPLRGGHRDRQGDHGRQPPLVGAHLSLHLPDLRGRPPSGELPHRGRTAGGRAAGDVHVARPAVGAHLAAPLRGCRGRVRAQHDAFGRSRGAGAPALPAAAGASGHRSRRVAGPVQGDAGRLQQSAARPRPRTRAAAWRSRGHVGGAAAGVGDAPDGGDGATRGRPRRRGARGVDPARRLVDPAAQRVLAI
jgi:TolB-like protein